VRESFVGKQYTALTTGNIFGNDIGIDLSNFQVEWTTPGNLGQVSSIDKDTGEVAFTPVTAGTTYFTYVVTNPSSFEVAMENDFVAVGE